MSLITEPVNKTVQYIAIGALTLCALILVLVILITVGEKNENSKAVSGETAEEPVLTEQTFELLPSPTPAPEPFIRYDESEGDGFVQTGYRHELGTVFSLGGTVVSNYPIKAVTVSFSCAYNNNNDTYPYKQTVHPAGDDVFTFSLRDTATREKKSLSECVNFRELLTGVNTVKLIVTTSAQKSEEILRVRFYVMDTRWNTMKESDFGNSYDEALAFFKDPERFVYRYQWVNGRYTLADPDWEETYITYMEGLPAGTSWRVHTDAVPYMTRAIEYLSGSLVRVHGTNGDSGVIYASELISEYNGAYVSRFTSSLKTLSHHTFGTAVDLNASMEPNKNTSDNKSVIYKDVKNHLKYNGILYDELNRPYYDFTYDGDYKTDTHSVPQTCVNYLLYELGFFRAGFLWAHYYSNTSDAMHFTLSEQVSGGSFEGKYKLRQVYEYAPLLENAESEEETVGGAVTPAPEETPVATASPLPTESPAVSPTATESAAVTAIPAESASASGDLPS